jgi:hypothetical protein
MYIGHAIVTCNNASPRIIGTVKLIFMNIETPCNIVNFFLRLYRKDYTHFLLSKHLKNTFLTCN